MVGTSSVTLTIKLAGAVLSPSLSVAVNEKVSARLLAPLPAG